ncbi:hypothetical protein IL306_009950 [Fusarium sp. DS 682]|nr:hypothetical protein IL306_009950 [Fusarium sp. DS 682]
MISTGFLTATQQADLQTKFWEARNMLLKRTMRCIFEDCDFTFRLDDHEARKRHTLQAHKSRKCPWCDEPLFEWWDKAQVTKHMREKHADELKQILGITGNAAPGTVPAIPRPAPSHPVASAETGRLIQIAHELQNIAHSGRLLPLQKPSGNPQPVAQTQSAQPQSTQPFVLGQVESPFNAPRSVPPRSTPPRPAPAPRPVQDIPSPVAMPKRPPGMPLAAERKLSQPPRRLDTRTWHDIAGPKPFADPPTKCPWCNDPNIGRLSSAGMWEHFKELHYDKKIDHCPFCHLPLFIVYATNDKGEELRKEHTKEECIKHMDCHIYELWDLAAENRNRSNHQNAQGSQSGDGEIVQTRRARAAQEAEARARKAAKEKAQAEARAKQSEEIARIPLKAPEYVKKCAYFHKCGVMVGHVTEAQYLRHIKDSHKNEAIGFVPSDDDEDNEDAGDDGDDDNNDSSDEGDDDDDDDGGSRQRRIPPTRRPPLPDASKSKSPSPDPRVIEVDSDDEAMDVDSNKSTGAVVVTKKPTPKKPAAKKPATKKTGNRRTSPAPQIESCVESHSEVASTVSRGRRRSTQRATSGPPEIASPSAEVQVSETKSSATEGRHRTKKAKKSNKTRPAEEKDGEYEDDGYETDDYDEEPNEQGGPSFRRRAKSPDWMKKLGPEDPDFDPDDDMYCSKCLRKVPKKRSKSPNRSPIDRDAQVESHTDKQRCCGIRNAPGDPEKLPNRSGWIKSSDMPKKLGQLKDKFRRRYPTYARTIYPTNPADHFASVWRSDPNNPDNKDWWEIPWPPYEGYPPFPGTWEAPGMPWDDTTAGRKRRDKYIGIQARDPSYRYQSDSDSGESIQPDIREDISDLAIDANPGLKRPGSEITSAEEVEAEEPVAKKAKTGESLHFSSNFLLLSSLLPLRTETEDLTETKTTKGGNKSGKASSQPSRASSRIRMQKKRASPAPSTAASTVAVAKPAASKAASKAAPSKTATSKAATAAKTPAPEDGSSDPDR